LLGARAEAVAEEAGVNIVVDLARWLLCNALVVVGRTALGLEGAEPIGPDCRYRI
jgi:hypothetical protein